MHLLASLAVTGPVDILALPGSSSNFAAAGAAAKDAKHRQPHWKLHPASWVGTLLLI